MQAVWTTPRKPEAIAAGGKPSDAEHVQEAVGAPSCAYHTCTYLEAGIYVFTV